MSVLSGLKTRALIHDCEFFNRYKISDIDQLILAQIFRFGLTLV